MQQETLQSVVESLFFVAETPVSLIRLKEVFGEEGPKEEDIQLAIDAIKAKFVEANLGFELREASGGYRFVTRPSNSEWVRKFLQTKPFRLGRSALEVMAIIAYRQPITRAEIDKVRGIDSSHLLRTLIERNLVKMAGKAEVPGRPVQYATTDRFIEVLGLKSLGDLPPLSELEQLQGHTEAPVDKMEEGLDRFIADHTRPETEETPEEEEQGIGALTAMIDAAGKADREIYSSAAASEVARENEAALEGFLEHMKPRRKRHIAIAVDGAEDVAPTAESTEPLTAAESTEPPLAAETDADLDAALEAVSEVDVEVTETETAIEEDAVEEAVAEQELSSENDEGDEDGDAAEETSAEPELQEEEENKDPETPILN